jgi:hypothetical protein
LERATAQQAMARTRSSTGNLPKDKEVKVSVEEMKEKLEAQLKLQRAAHQQRKGQATVVTTSTDNGKTSTPQHVIKIVPNSQGSSFV